MLDRSTLATEGTHLARFLRAGAVGTVDQDGLRSVQPIAAAVRLRGASEDIMKTCFPNIRPKYPATLCIGLPDRGAAIWRGVEIAASCK